MPANHAAVHTKRSAWRLALLVAVGVLVLLLCWATWVAVRGAIAKGDLDRSAALIANLKQQISHNNIGGAQQSARELSANLDEARDLSDDPLWRGSEWVPGAGPNLVAVRQVCETLARVSDRAIIPASRILGSVSPSQFKPAAGAIDIKPLVQARPTIAEADVAVKNALAEARGIRTDGTIGQIGGAVEKVVHELDQASHALTAIDQAAAVLPPLLGEDGPRNYLLLFQNNAESRSTGGIPGALAVIHAEAGHISLAAQASAAAFPGFPRPVSTIPVETQGIYGAIVGQYVQDVTLTPQFPLTASLAREMWRQKFGTEVDGVISIDPVALGYVLGATGPIVLPTGDSMTSANAVKLLLSDSYARYNGGQQKDEFFTEAASAVFSKVSKGEFDPKAMIGAFMKAGAEHRILMWSADPSEQATIGTSALGGTLPTSTPTAPAFGVYLNDATGAKMDYYLDVKTAVGQSVCRKDRRPTWTISISLTNNAPANASTKLSPYVTGGGDFGVPPGQVRTNVAVYAPPGSLFAGSTITGIPASVHTAADSTYPVGLATTQLAPGESTTIRMQFLGDSHMSGTPTIDQTPVIDLHPTTQMTVPCGQLARGGK